MKYLVPKTLDYYLTAPQFKLLDTSEIPVKAVAAQCRVYHDQTPECSPATRAVNFYTLNHLMNMLVAKYGRYEPLPDWAVSVGEAFHKELADQTQRMFFYMLLITTRESRHLYEPTEEWVAGFKEKFGVAGWNFHLKIKGKTSHAAAHSLMNHPPKMPLGKYVLGLEHQFRNGMFSSGYGGVPWANIAKTLAKFVHGEITMEVMLDTAYTLAHNNGPMFNKGMLYDADWSKTILTQILDVQRAGQMPEMVTETVGQYYTQMKPLVQLVAENVPGAFGVKVDWDKVEALGSIGNYAHKKESFHTVVPSPGNNTVKIKIGPMKSEVIPDLPGKKFVKKFAVWVNKGQVQEAYQYERVA